MPRKAVIAGQILVVGVVALIVYKTLLEPDHKPSIPGANAVGVVHHPPGHHHARKPAHHAGAGGSGGGGAGHSAGSTGSATSGGGGGGTQGRPTSSIRRQTTVVLGSRTNPTVSQYSDTVTSIQTSVGGPPRTVVTASAPAPALGHRVARQLPFTGLDLLAALAVAIALTSGGFALRRIAGPPPTRAW